MNAIKTALQAIGIVISGAVLLYAMWISSIVLGILLAIVAVYFVLKETGE